MHQVNNVIALPAGRFGAVVMIMALSACGGSSGSDFLDSAIGGDADSSSADGQGEDSSGADAEAPDSSGGTCNPSSCKACVLGQASCTSPAGSCQCCLGSTCVPD